MGTPEFAVPTLDILNKKYIFFIFSQFYVYSLFGNNFIPFLKK